MNQLEKVITEMDFNYFGSGRHIMDVATFLDCEDAVLLDVRAKEEVESIKIGLRHHCPVLEIPMHEVPARLNEIPRDKTIGLFCSSSIRSVIIFTYLKSKGFEKARILPGGYQTLTDALKPGKIHKKVKG